MRYITLLTATSTPEGPPPGELMAAIAKLGEQATQAGVLLDTAGLAPSAAGARIELKRGSVSVSDGPFTEAKELVSYAIYQVAAKEEAVSGPADSCTHTSSTGPGVAHKFTNDGPGRSKLVCIHASPTFIGEWLE